MPLSDHGSSTTTVQTYVPVCSPVLLADVEPATGAGDGEAWLLKFDVVSALFTQSMVAFVLAGVVSELNDTVSVESGVLPNFSAASLVEVVTVPPPTGTVTV